MPGLAIRLPEWLADATLAGLPLLEHWRQLASNAGVAVDEGGRPFDGSRLLAGPAVLTRAVASDLVDGTGRLLAGADLGAAGEGEACPEAGPAVTNPVELAAAEELWMNHHLRALVASGVRVLRPGTCWIDRRAHIAPGAIIEPGVVVHGGTVVEAGAILRAGCWLRDAHVAAGAEVRPHSVCDGARVGAGAKVGPMAHLREGAVLEEDVRVGNFVEVKKTVLHAGAKASHLTYLGDAEVGSGANVGAGTITCNYDGHGKHRTIIGEGAFIGSNTALVAPIRVGDGAIVAAGSTLTEDVPDGALALGRARQHVVADRATDIHARNAERARRR